MPHPQPRVVRTATIAILVCAVLMIVQAIGTLQNVGSQEMVDAIDKALGMSWAKSSHLSVPTLQTVLRVAANVAAVVAAAAAVLAVFAGRGSRQARLGLTVLALPILIATLMSGGYAGLPLLVGIGMLWSRTARPWFRGEPAVAGPGGSPGTLRVPAPPSVQPLIDGVPTPPAPVVPMSTTRPSKVTTAAVVAIVLSSLAAAGGLLGGLGLAMLKGQPDMRQEVIDRLHQQNVTLSVSELDRYLTPGAVAAAVVAVLGLAGVLAASAVLRRSARGRIALVILSGVCAVISLILITSILSVVWLAGAIAVIVALNSIEARAWFNRG